MSPKKGCRSSRPLRLTQGGNQFTLRAHEAFLKDLVGRDPHIVTTQEVNNSC